jgi:hypothetical protein
MVWGGEKGAWQMQKKKQKGVNVVVGAYALVFIYF